MSGLKAFMKRYASLVDRELDHLMSPHRDEPQAVRRAMRYSIFAGGKRLRPLLVIAAAESCGMPGRRVLSAASALEMIHTYSLIHDDLPAMDDDDLRRGKPTNHKVFGEALAILAGDGLLTSAFAAAAANARLCGLGGRETAELISVIAAGAGTRGMVGGQVADLEADGRNRRGHSPKKSSKGLNGGSGKILEYIHLRKTAALLIASLEAGAILARATRAKRECLKDFGRSMGLAFQIADDILDVVGDKAKLGKRGSDKANNKLTYASLYGIAEARLKAEALREKAHLSLKPLGSKALLLHEIADYVIAREN